MLLSRHQRVIQILIYQFFCCKIFSFRIYTCKNNKWRETEFVDREWTCREAQVTKACIQEAHETCMGFFQDQVKIFVEDYYVQGGRPMPECLNPYLKPDYDGSDNQV